MRCFGPTPTQGVFRGDFQYSFPGVVRLFQGCNTYRCKEGINDDSYCNKNGNIPPVRGVTGLPVAMSGCGATCTLRGLPGVVGTPGRSEVARWKAMITAVIVVYYIAPKVSVAQMEGMFPLVLDTA